MVGSFLYFIGISEWLCVASRFISGLGAASEAIAVAEVSRYTSEQERTGIISNLIATRQVALLLGPALNLFLRLADFKVGPFSVTKYSAPGAFMAMMWALLVLVVLALYTEPYDIYAEEQAGAQVEGMSTNESCAQASSPKWHAHSRSFDLLASDDGTETVYPPLSSEKQPGSYNYDEWDNSEEYHEIRPGKKFIDHQDSYISGAVGGSNSGGTISSQKSHNFVSPSHIVNSNCVDFEISKAETASRGNGENRCIVKAGSDTSNGGVAQLADLEASEDFHDTWMGSLPSDQVDLSSSVEILARAERLINRNQWSASQKDVLAYDGACSAGADAEGDENLYFCDNHFSQSEAQDGSVVEADERTSLLGTSHRRQNAPIQSQSGESDPYIERSFTAIDDPISREGKLGFCCNEYIRDEIIAILCLLFCAMFSQVCVETMVLPLSLEYLDFGELENSLLYF
ncbi:hypothetical protein EGW08_014058, partial [Elysia chlorotica]